MHTHGSSIMDGFAAGYDTLPPQDPGLMPPPIQRATDLPVPDSFGQGYAPQDDFFVPGMMPPSLPYLM
jgi:hypothetical protein